MPSVSIIVPCYNEQATIRLLLEAIYHQTYPLKNMEVILADGRSTDGTRQEVTNFQTGHPDLKVMIVDNVDKNIPAGLNCALNAAVGEIVVRMDAHCIPAPNYVETSVTDVRAGLGWNVGGVWEIRPGARGWMAESIAAAAAHPLGVGDALYRYTTQAGEVDTVPFGAYRRSLIAEIGGYDETLLTNEDYEFNTRIHKNGGKVWLDPQIRSVYFARHTPVALARQYFRYGYWKLKMLRRYPNTLRWRQALPPVFVLSLAGLGLLSIFMPLARWAILLELAVYFLILAAASIRLAVKKEHWSYIPGIPLAIAIMHVSWGSGFLWSIFKR